MANLLDALLNDSSKPASYMLAQQAQDNAAETAKVTSGKYGFSGDKGPGGFESPKDVLGSLLGGGGGAGPSIPGMGGIGGAAAAEGAAGAAGTGAAIGGGAAAAGGAGAAGAGAAGAAGAGAAGAAAGGGGIAALLPFLAALSDRRAKENIVATGGTVMGVPEYEWSYIGSKTRFVGPMAQDLELVRPDLVAEVNGMKFIPVELVSISISSAQ